MNIASRLIAWVREKNHARLLARRARSPRLAEFPAQYRKAAAPAAPTRVEWDALLAARRGQGAEPVVDVVIPVYRGLDETMRCLHTVLAATCRTPHAVIVVEDASPEPLLVEELRWLADAGLIELLRNERNAGFVASCNRGMSVHPDRDVVLLNSDTEVYGDWLDRLRAAAASGRKVGTVTPLSNNATICSYPFFVRDNDMALELGYAELDRLAWRANARRYVDVPTAVGFCMYVRRACLDQVGAFDVERFGRGYGEENDLCLRATEQGWQHLLACDVFVRHSGGVSFGAEKEARIARALAEIAKRFPDYAAQVARFVEADPPREARRRLDLARMASRARSGTIVFVTNQWGGGIERHVRDLARRLRAEGVAVAFLRPEPGEPRRAALSHFDVWPTPNVGSFELLGELEPLVDALRQLDVRHLHVHSLVGFDQPVAAGWIPRVASALGVAYDFTVHDYVSVCPRINLVGTAGSYCGEPAIEGCQRCLAECGSPFGKVAIRDWRAAYERLLCGARRVFAPGEDAARRIARYFPDVEPAVRPHLEDLARPAVARAVPRVNGEPLRVAVIGAIAPHKGFEVLKACARDASARRLPIAFRLVGTSCDDAALKAWGNVEVLGEYADPDLPRLLEAERCHCALFPSVWPETYSYTLSAALAAGLHPTAFDIGVPAERIRSLGWGTLVPLGAGPAAVNDALLGANLGTSPDPRKLRAQLAACESVLRDYYGLEPRSAEETVTPASFAWGAE